MENEVLPSKKLLFFDIFDVTYSIVWIIEILCLAVVLVANDIPFKVHLLAFEITNSLLFMLATYYRHWMTLEIMSWIFAAATMFLYCFCAATLAMSVADSETFVKIFTGSILACSYHSDLATSTSQLADLFFREQNEVLAQYVPEDAIPLAASITDKQTIFQCLLATCFAAGICHFGLSLLCPWSYLTLAHRLIGSVIIGFPLLVYFFCKRRLLVAYVSTQRSFCVVLVESLGFSLLALWKIGSAFIGNISLSHGELFVLVLRPLWSFCCVFLNGFSFLISRRLLFLLPPSHQRPVTENAPRGWAAVAA